MLCPYLPSTPSLKCVLQLHHKFKVRFRSLKNWSFIHATRIHVNRKVENEKIENERRMHVYH